MRIESSGHSKANPRLFELIEAVPAETGPADTGPADTGPADTGPAETGAETGRSPTVWAWPELVDYLKVAGQPVSGPWPPHQEPRPDPDYESGPVAVPDPASDERDKDE